MEQDQPTAAAIAINAGEQNGYLVDLSAGRAKAKFLTFVRALTVAETTCLRFQSLDGGIYQQISVVELVNHRRNQVVGRFCRYFVQKFASRPFSIARNARSN